MFLFLKQNIKEGEMFSWLEKLANYFNKSGRDKTQHNVDAIMIIEISDIVSVFRPAIPTAQEVSAKTINPVKQGIDTTIAWINKVSDELEKNKLIAFNNALNALKDSIPDILENPNQQIEVNSKIFINLLNARSIMDEAIRALRLSDPKENILFRKNIC